MAPFWDPPDLKKQGFRVEGVPFFEKSWGSEKHPKNGNLAIMEREAREIREHGSNAKQVESSERGENVESRSAKART